MCCGSQEVYVTAEEHLAMEICLLIAPERYKISSLKAHCYKNYIEQWTKKRWNRVLHFWCICKSCRRTIGSRESVFSTLELYTVFVSYCWSNRLPQTLCLKTTHIYYITVLGVRRIRWISLGWNQSVSRVCVFSRPEGRICFLVFSGSWRPSHAFALGPLQCPKPAMDS